MVLINKVRENLYFKQSKGENLNFLLKNKIFQIKPLLKNKIFPKIEFGDFIIKLVDTKSELKKAQALRYSVFYKEKKALFVSSELDYQDKQNEIKKDATNVWSEYLLKKSELDLAKAQLQAAEIAYEGIIQEYENGSRDTLDVLNSRSLLLVARLNFTDIERDEIVSRFKLLKVTGNLTSLYLKLETKQINPKTNWIRHIF